MAPSNPLDENTSLEVQGSGRTIFYLLKIVGDVIDDELQVSDANKCAGKKVDMGKRVVRAVASAGSKASVVQERLGSSDASQALTGSLIGGSTAFVLLAVLFL